MASIKQSNEFPRQALVEVKGSWEILETLDSDGKLDGLPFMPEMLGFCGKQIRVLRKADRTCVVGRGFRRMRSAVFLQESRCDGSHHDGCQRACLLFWNEAWLRSPGTPRPRAPNPEPQDAAASRILAALATRRGDRYMCQSTELAGATEAISRWDLRPWLREVLRGDLAARRLVVLVARIFLSRVFGIATDNMLAGERKTAGKGDLGLSAGDWVRVKSADEICTTLDAKGRNRGLSFQPTMNPSIGRRFPVAFPVRRIIIENTGEMAHLSNTVALEGVTCRGQCVAHCPRGEYLYWRESWLERDAGEGKSTAEAGA